MKKSLIQSQYEALKLAAKAKSPKQINLSKQTGVTSTIRQPQDIKVWVTNELQKLKDEMYRELSLLRIELKA